MLKKIQRIQKFEQIKRKKERKKEAKAMMLKIKRKKQKQRERAQAQHWEAPWTILQIKSKVQKCRNKTFGIQALVILSLKVP